MLNNLTPQIGDNTKDAPDYAKIEIERLGDDYSELSKNVVTLIDEAEQVTLPIADDAVKGTVASLIKRLRDTARRADTFRETEKQPHFRRGQAVDQFFFGMIDRLSKRDRKNKDGIADTLQTALTDYDNRKIEEERAKRRAEAEAAERERRRLEAIAVEAARVAEEKRLAAERAKKPEHIAAKDAAANTAEIASTEALIDANLAAGKAEDKYVETLAKPADFMRNRGTDGTLTTVAQEGYAEIENATLLDKELLWPFISLDAKEKALRAYAKNTGHRTQMTGAKIGFRNKSVVR